MVGWSGERKENTNPGDSLQVKTQDATKQGLWFDAKFV